MSQRRILPVAADGLMAVEIVVDGKPPVLSRTTFSPWLRLWEQVEALAINDSDKPIKVGAQDVRPGFSVWAKLKLNDGDLIKSARGSLKSLEERHRDEWLLQVQTVPDGLFFRKVRPDRWSERHIR